MPYIYPQLLTKTQYGLSKLPAQLLDFFVNLSLSLTHTYASPHPSFSPLNKRLVFLQDFFLIYLFRLTLVGSINSNNV